MIVFSSILEDGKSNSKLTIENFKIKNAPAVVKLLSISRLWRSSRFREGEGLSFDKLEINMNNEILN